MNRKLIACICAVLVCAAVSAGSIFAEEYDSTSVLQYISEEHPGQTEEAAPAEQPGQTEEAVPEEQLGQAAEADSEEQMAIGISCTMH